ncbi:hypothetical protein DTO013E5_8562 [Penicillium roqueforti]|uniref:Genomic scaffold, ProqFM164S02 n=1 Tax=Penicillium roqueforti (strain FM164) TaxID=1365484 RepID=W6Q0W9_PENRF|nr:uncharacterized protein LCP9604111_4765 [Penicillium roqueforti]CDM30193.1 unnamed protein product [Penicillium roqueforti FM164]KAF9249049.1 hypothetical protein LCP9604111_4765 [Penicillium roqueforti]KAI1832127.1 hypothetical protein CBS147337_7199 [Penicillium roqueforti]KAI2673408.1 hypothetical protein CBS147355_7707 [Penicillium roqueforti]KAI2673567.1 hypothetical protein LCP963914a_9013 [Penicillium roqueforti]
MSTEHTRDWSTLLLVEKQTGPTDQAFELPEIACFTLYQFPCPLKHPSDYLTWRNDIYHILKVHRLHRLIDSGIVRPYRDSPNARRWQQMSIEVRNWLAWNMNPILVCMIAKEQPRAELADEFMMGAEKILGPYTRSPAQDYEDISSGLFNLIRCRRCDYSSARWFVHRLMEYYTHTLNMKMGIPPFVPLLILLAEVESDVGTAFVNLRYERLKNMHNFAQDVTKAYLEEVYLDVLDYLECMDPMPIE